MMANCLQRQQQSSVTSGSFIFGRVIFKLEARKKIVFVAILRRSIFINENIAISSDNIV